MTSEIKPTKLQTQVPGIKEDELLYVLNEEGTAYVSSNDGTTLGFNRNRMLADVGNVFKHACLEAWRGKPYPEYACPKNWQCDHCSIGKTVARARARHRQFSPPR